MERRDGSVAPQANKQQRSAQGRQTSKHSTQEGIMMESCKLAHQCGPHRAWDAVCQASRERIVLILLGC